MAFQKGKSGNPGGRPKSKPFYDALSLEIKAAGEDHKQLRSIANKLLEQAEKGEAWAIKELADRLDGKPMQSIDQSIEVTDSLSELISRIDGKSNPLVKG